MSAITIRRHETVLQPVSERIIVLPFIPSNVEHVSAIVGRAMALTDQQAESELQSVLAEFDARHFNIEAALLLHFELVALHSVPDTQPLSLTRRLLIGALFSGEYALESSALFNPSIVPHPDQSGAPKGGLRFIMSLRATGEGHISSIEFRAGSISRKGDIAYDPISRFVTLPEVLPNPKYRKRIFSVKLREMGFDNDCARTVLAPLGEFFTRNELAEVVARADCAALPNAHDSVHTLDCIQWLADSNYELFFSPRIALSERIIFPVSTNESKGIEDARFVKFIDTDGAVMYYATYTAYNGHDILPQLIETEDFSHFRVLTLNGDAVQNKGMALFPRRIDGDYFMLSRQDDENLFIMRSDNPHYWSNPQPLMQPVEPWESVKIGNCGSPIETEAGWLVITHGVGPLRKYCIGAALLDLDDPTKVIGRLKEPILSPESNQRDGYVPNVVYSCGSLLHGDTLILPYAMNDKTTAIVSIPLKELLEKLKA